MLFTFVPEDGPVAQHQWHTHNEESNCRRIGEVVGAAHVMPKVMILFGRRV